MTEFEIASLAVQEATVRVGIALVVATVGVGLLQAGIVWYGIRAMQKAGDRRAREQDQRHEETMTSLRERHEETMTAHRERHEEAMTSLRALIERHDGNMTTLRERHEETMTAHRERHEEAMVSLRALIERTAPPATGAG